MPLEHLRIMTYLPGVQMRNIFELLQVKAKELTRPNPAKAVGATSRWVAAARAMESARPDALFQDTFASALAGDADPHGKSYTTYLSIRTRFFDDTLSAAVRNGEIGQVV